jgi:DNA-binding GntR family transcriptional regulator
VSARPARKTEEPQPAAIFPLPKDDRNTQAAQAGRLILGRIARLELAPGSTFSERELAAEIGMGKMPVREALHQLHHTGLVEAHFGSGYAVAPITLRAARNLFDFWATLLGRGVELATVHTSKSDVQKISDALAVVKAQARSGEDDDVDEIRYEILFQLVAAALGNNEHLTVTIAHLATEFERLLRFASTRGATGLGEVLGDHDAIVDALKARAAVAARKAATAHVSRLGHAVLDALLTSDEVQDVKLGSGH